MKRFSTIALLASLGALAAYAGSPADTFTAMDLDASGDVNETEFVTWALGEGHTEEDAKAKFLDVAGDDGTLSLEELETAMADYKADEAEPADTSDSEDRGY